MLTIEFSCIVVYNNAKPRAFLSSAGTFQFFPGFTKDQNTADQEELSLRTMKKARIKTISAFMA